MITIENERFEAVLREFSEDVVAASPSSIELLFDEDIPVRVSLHPDGEDVIIDAFVSDFTNILGAARQIVVRLLLQLNGVAIQGRAFSTAITPSGLIAVVVRIPLDAAAADGLAGHLQYAVAQAGSLRTMIAAVAPDDQLSVATFTT